MATNVHSGNWYLQNVARPTMALKAERKVLVGIVWRIMAQSNMGIAMYPHVPAVPELVGGLKYRKFQGFGFGAKSAVGWTESRCRRVRKTVLFSKRTTEDSSRVA